MIEPVFPNAVRRAIVDVTHDNKPASVLQDPVALHHAALTWNDDGVEPAALLASTAHPRLARGTLLMLYWRAAPGYYRRYASTAEVSDREREDFETCQTLAGLYLSRTDMADGIAFDPRNDDGYNWTTAHDGNADPSRRGEYPSPLLLAPVPGEAVAWPVGPDQLTRLPNATEQATIAAGVARGRALLPDLPAGALSCFVPDIVSRTAEAGIDPAETMRFFDLVRRMPPGLPDDDFWAGSHVAFAAGWLG